MSVTILFFGSLAAVAQQPSQPPTDSKPTQKDPTTEKQSQRTLGVLPSFGVTNQRNAPPLTPSGKFRLFYRSAFDPAEFVVTGAQAGISQAQDGFHAYGQGASGYGKRYGAAFTDQVSSGFFTNFVYPTLLKEDPRYFRLGEGPFKRRLGYALSQEFIAHKDQGGRTFHWPNTLGAITAGGISNAYYPANDRGFGLTMSRAGISMLYGSLGGLGSEFWPDIYRKIHHRRQKPLPPGEQAQKEDKR